MLTFLVWMQVNAAETLIASFRNIDPALTDVVIARTVTSIPDYAFAEMTSLRSVKFESGSRCGKIGDYAFYHCDSLTRFQVPPALREVGKYSFAWCAQLTQFDCSPLVSIGPLAFAYCENLAAIHFGSQLRKIGNNAFSRCMNLTSVVLPSHVQLIDSYAFSDCHALKTVSLPANNQRLGELIFSGCISLEEIKTNSPSPPLFECESFIFDPQETDLYQQCRLLVRSGLVEMFRTAPGWCLFQRVETIGK